MGVGGISGQCTASIMGPGCMCHNTTAALTAPTQFKPKRDRRKVSLVPVHTGTLQDTPHNMYCMYDVPLLLAAAAATMATATMGLGGSHTEDNDPLLRTQLSRSLPTSLGCCSRSAAGFTRLMHTLGADVDLSLCCVRCRGGLGTGCGALGEYVASAGC